VGNKVSEIVLLTTTDATAARTMEIARLVQSVERARRSLADIPLRHHFLVQRCASIQEAIKNLDLPAWMTVTTSHEQLPLSVARNQMLSAVAREGLDADALVAFPDDDAWYAQHTLEHIVQRFAANESLDFWFCRYGSEPNFTPDETERSASLQNVLSWASSNTTFIRGKVLQAIGGFDERLGLGTPLRGGEDTEFAIRAYFAAQETRFVQERRVGHRDYSPQHRGRYYPGAAIAIARHANRSAEARKALIRKLGVGFALVLRREMEVGQLLAMPGLFKEDRLISAGQSRPRGAA
jgi:hypothetical protein